MIWWGIKMRYKKSIKKFLKSERGNATLEAAYLYPSLLMMTIFLLFFTIVVYQKALVNFQARKAADQIAYIWNNNSDNLNNTTPNFNGDFKYYSTDTPNGDGLYWKVFQNNALKKYSLDFFKSDSTLVSEKEAAAQVHFQTKSVVDLKVEYQNALVSKYSNEVLATESIQVTATSGFKIPSVLKQFTWLNKKISATATAEIYDPVENIRTVKSLLFITGKLAEKVKFLKDIIKLLGL
ncbi:hypothetical protein CDIMF43_70003 [Carnobacterium divergens]|nr:hypothetical protein CDIMF43_70003 [Carnobacterium divergens]